jgi:hypothetical protein
MSCTMFPRMKMHVEECCKQHDRDYSRYTKLSRYRADLNFFRCVWKHNKFFAIVMYIGVRLFGHRYYKT